MYQGSDPGFTAPSTSQSISEVWLKVITQPSVETFEEIIRDPNANRSTGIKWVFLSSLISYAIVYLIGFFIRADYYADMGQTYSIAMIICGPLISACISVIGLIINAGISQAIASALDGTGTYSQLVYAIAAYMAPLIGVSSLLSLIPILRCFNIPLAIYVIVLNIIAIKAVNQFSWSRAVASSFIFLALILVFVACIVIMVLALLGPMIGEIYSNVMQGL